MFKKSLNDDFDSAEKLKLLNWANIGWLFKKSEMYGSDTESYIIIIR